MNDLISVIIPSYNSESFVCDAVRSVLAQTFSPLEILVIDDGSTDNTRGVLEQFGDRIRYYRQENRGPASARNTGIHFASGKLLAFLDADDVWLPDKLSKQYNVLAQQSEIGLVHSDIRYWHQDTGEKNLKWVGRERFAGDCYICLFYENRVLTSSILVRKECFGKAGLFDERLGRAEDWDMLIRIARHYRFAYIPEPLIDYRLHGAGLTNNEARMRESELRVLVKALRADPQLTKQLGKSFINNMLAHKSLCIGYQFLEDGDIKTARYYFGKAFVFDPRRAFRGLSLFAWCFLPGKLAMRLRDVKGRYLPGYTFSG